MTKRSITLILVALILGCLMLFGWILSDGSYKDVKSLPTETSTATPATVSTAAVTVIATGLKIPWDLAFLPDQSMLVTERAGNLVRIDKDGAKSSIKLPHPVPRGEGGLLGIVLHPNFANNKYLYLYMTTQSLASGTKNAVYRYKYENGVLTDEKTIISGIPGAIYHDGGRMEFGPDGMLYITTGDATDEKIAQDKNSLGGKILRLTDNGDIPSDNPFGTAVYSYGHRNPQGLAWDADGRLWSTEHGRSGITSGMDELNIIEKGGNYGWPVIEGDEFKEGMKKPVENSGPDMTWAPASAAFYKGSIYFGGLKGEALYEVLIDEHADHIHEFKTHFLNRFGRIRTVRVGPDGMLYLTTSNRDGRGKPVDEDDRIIRVNPDKI